MNGRKSARRRKLSPLPKLKIIPAKSSPTLEFLKSPIKKYTNVSPKVDNKGIKIQAKSPKLIKIDNPLPKLDGVKSKVKSVSRRHQVVKSLTKNKRVIEEENENLNKSLAENDQSKSEKGQTISSSYFVVIEKSEPISDTNRELVTENISTDKCESSSISGDEKDLDSDVKCPEIKLVDDGDGDGEDIVENITLVENNISSSLYEREHSEIQKRVSFDQNLNIMDITPVERETGDNSKLSSTETELHKNSNEKEEKLQKMLRSNNSLDTSERESSLSDLKDENLQPTLKENVENNCDEKDERGSGEEKKDSPDGEATQYVNYPHDLRPSHRLPQRMSSRRSTALIYRSLCCGLCQTFDTDTWEDVDKNRGCWAWFSNKIG